MQKVIKQSRALLLMLAFLLAFAPMSALAGSGEKQNITYVSLGDSLAAGMLSDGTKSSPGYAGKIESELILRGYKVKPKKYGKPGYTSQNVLAGLPGVKELSEADIITISAGANDVLPVLNALNPLDLIGLDPAFLDKGKRYEILGAAEGIAAVQKMVADGKLDIKVIDGAVTAVKDVETTLAEQGAVFSRYLADPVIGPLLIGTQKVVSSAVESVKKAHNDYENAQASFGTDAEVTLGALNESVKNLEEARGSFKVVIDSFTGLNLPEDLQVAAQVVLGKIDYANVGINTSLYAIQGEENIVGTIGSVIAFVKAQKTAEKIGALVQGVDNIEAAILGVGKNTAAILREIRQKNPEAKIYVMGYYNALYYLPQELQAVMVPLLERLNAAIAEASSIPEFGAKFIVTASFFDGKYGTYLPNPPDIHPNIDGYAALSEAFLTEIRNDFTGYTAPEEPGELIIDLNEKINVSAGQKVLINNTDVSLLLPADLPEGTTLTITPTSDDVLAKADGLKAVGEVLNFTFEFPEESPDYKGKYTLVMGYDADESFDVDIYYFDVEKDTWVAQEGKVNKESKEISLEVSHFSNYGVFAKVVVEKEDPPVTEEPDDEDDDDKTPPVVKDPGKDPGKDPTKGNDTTKKPTAKPTPEGSKLPKTATNNVNLMLIGTILLVTGLATLGIRPKKVLS